MDSSVLFIDDRDEIKKFLEIFPDKINDIVNDMTPLMHAIRNTRYDIIDLLVEKRCDINIKNNRGETAVHYACEMAYLDQRVIEKLIGIGANGNIADNFGFTPFHRAAMFINNVNIINLLIPISDPNLCIPAGLNSLMLACAYNRNLEVISVLIDVTHNINLYDQCGWTALCNICNSQYYEGIKLLLHAGAKYNVVNAQNAFEYLNSNLKQKVLSEILHLDQ